MQLAFLFIASLVSSVTSFRRPSLSAFSIRKQPFESLFEDHQVSSDSIVSILSHIRGGYSNDTTSDINQAESSDTTRNTTMKQCRCVLCGQEILAESQADCEAHMTVCPAFARVHPQDGSTNPNGVYPPGSEPPHSMPRVEEVQSSESDDVDVYSLSVKELKRVITNAGLSHVDCIEKSDLQARAAEALNR